MRGSLLVGCDNVGDTVLILIECIENLKDLSSRVAEYRIAALRYQEIDNDLSAVLFHVFLLVLAK